MRISARKFDDILSRRNEPVEDVSQRYGVSKNYVYKVWNGMADRPIDRGRSINAKPHTGDLSVSERVRLLSWPVVR